MSERREDRSLRGHLLRLLLLPVAGILAVSSVAAYYLALDPATEAHDASLIDAGLALGERLRTSGGVTTLDLPSAAEQVLRTDKYDTVYYVVRDPAGKAIAGDAGVPLPPSRQRPQDGSVLYNAEYRGTRVRAATLLAPCAGQVCTIVVAETTRKRDRLVREILLGSVLPQALLAVLTLILVWFGVARGLLPLQRLSDEIGKRSARDLSPIGTEHVPEETRALVGALNQLLVRVEESNRNQQRFLANAAHQLRTPLAGLQAHAELALTAAPESARSELAQVHAAAVRMARLANQLLALARAEAGGPLEPRATVELKGVVEGVADEWVHRAMERDVDLGFELQFATVQGDALLLREALGNLVHNALEYGARGGHVTVRTGPFGERGAFVEVEDDGPGIPAAERERVLERFYRAPGTPGTGSGLGLAIVQEIATAHGATLAIGAGADGKGCRVTIRFSHG
ncbi:MAG TPA: sensor histidine kinase N-terminal domain-containing protein [Burkholderiales bacterium]|nr:sensor histidine kinase N-terminal domain-containing protein [Burkholderiales bacterium]